MGDGSNSCLRRSPGTDPTLSELDRLDIFDIVAHDTKNLVIILTKETMSRPWCAGEMASAVRGSICIVTVACEDFDHPAEPFIETVGDLWSDQQKTEIEALGVT